MRRPAPVYPRARRPSQEKSRVGGPSRGRGRRPRRGRAAGRPAAGMLWAVGRLRIEGAIDLHCHYGPDMVGVFEGVTHSVTALEAAQEAGASGYAAPVLKSHDFATPALAHSLRQVVPGVRVFGGITLDHQAGGLNPAAVESALRLGAKLVWLPTLGSVQDWRSGLAPGLGYPGP